MNGHGIVERPQSEVFTVGYFARVAPEKGLHLLCDAYRRLRERSDFPASRLEVAGYLGPEHKAYLHGIEQQMKEWGLGDEFHYRGILDRDEKIKFLQSLDVMSVPATYDEPKGLSVIEAMANGVPVVQPRRGTFIELVERTGGGVLVEPDDPESLAEGILAIAKNPAAAREMGRKGHEGVRRHHSASRMAARALEVYGSLIERAMRTPASVTLAELT